MPLAPNGTSVRGPAPDAQNTAGVAVQTSGMASVTHARSPKAGGVARAVRGLSSAVDTRSQSLHGFGLRAVHYTQLLERGPQTGFVEAISENFMGRGGTARAVLERVRQSAEVALHGVSLSLGAQGPLCEQYLSSLDALQREVEPRFVSDHLCFGSHGGHYGHDLWPLPYTEEAIAHVAARIARVQDRLRRTILIENVSSYVEYRASVMPEWQFLSAVAERADCAILLDVNNVIVSAKNHGFDPLEYIAALPADRIAQLHLAGHTDYGTHAIDDHGSAVPECVHQLYEALVMQIGPRPAIIEWDEAVPELAELQRQCALARERERAALSTAQRGLPDLEAQRGAEGTP